MKMEQTECSETLAYKIHTLGNYPEETIQTATCVHEACSALILTPSGSELGRETGSCMHISKPSDFIKQKDFNPL